MGFNDEPAGATPLEPEEREELKHPHVTTRGQLDHLEQANIQEGMRWLSKYRRKDLLQEMNVRRDAYLQALRDADGGDYSGLLRFMGAGNE